MHSLGLPWILPHLGNTLTFFDDILTFFYAPEYLLNVALVCYMVTMCTLDLAKALVIHFFSFIAEMLSVSNHF